MDSGNQFDVKEIGLRVKTRAKELGYSTNDLAEEMNVEYATISRIYRGVSVKIEYIYELSEILGVSTDYLFKGNEDSIAMTKRNTDRDDNMKFLSGLSDRELAITVMHAKVTLGMFGV